MQTRRKLIIPTYINDEGTQQRKAVMLLEKLGVQFKREFDFRSYQQFSGISVFRMQHFMSWKAGCPAQLLF